MNLYDVVAVGDRPCKKCGQPHKEIIVGFKDGRVFSTSWAAENGQGHAYWRISDNEYIDQLKKEIDGLKKKPKNVGK